MKTNTTKQIYDANVTPVVVDTNYKILEVNNENLSYKRQLFNERF